MVRMIGIVLIAIGLLGLVFGGIEYTKKRHDAEFGPITVRYQERESVPISPIVAAVALIAGAVLVTTGAGTRRGQH